MVKTIKIRRCTLQETRKAFVLICAALLATAIETVAVPQSPGAEEHEGGSARRAYEILEQKCFPCHGASGVAMKNIFVLDRERLVSSRAVVPGDPNSLLLRMVNTGAMPMGGPELSQNEKAALKEWVLKGAPDGLRNEPNISARPRLTETGIM